MGDKCQSSWPHTELKQEAESKRMSFITDSTDIREMFAWAHPMQVLQATIVYSTSLYDSMLWNLYGEEANMVYRCWNTAAKLAWDLPRSTFTFLVDRVLTADLPSVRECLLTRYAMFLQGLYSSKTKELRILSSTASSDVRSTTGNNFAKLTRETDLELRSCRKHKVKEGLFKTTAPIEDEWRAPLLARLLEERRTMFHAEEDMKHLDNMIQIVCSSTIE